MQEGEGPAGDVEVEEDVDDGEDVWGYNLMQDDPCDFTQSRPL